MANIKEKIIANLHTVISELHKQGDLEIFTKCLTTAVVNSGNMEVFVDIVNGLLDDMTYGDMIGESEIKNDPREPYCDRKDISIWSMDV